MTLFPNEKKKKKKKNIYCASGEMPFSQTELNVLLKWYFSIIKRLFWFSLYYFFKSFDKEILWILVLAEA